MEHTAPAILELGLLLVLATLAGKAATRLGLPAGWPTARAWAGS